MPLPSVTVSRCAHAQAGNLGNEMADQLAKDAASNRDGETAYSKIPRRPIIKEIKKAKLIGNKNGTPQLKEKQQNHSFQI